MRLLSKKSVGVGTVATPQHDDSTQIACGNIKEAALAEAMEIRNKILHNGGTHDVAEAAATQASMSLYVSEKTAAGGGAGSGFSVTPLLTNNAVSSSTTPGPTTAGGGRGRLMLLRSRLSGRGGNRKGAVRGLCAAPDAPVEARDAVSSDRTGNDCDLTRDDENSSISTNDYTENVCSTDISSMGTGCVAPNRAEFLLIQMSEGQVKIPIIHPTFKTETVTTVEEPMDGKADPSHERWKAKDNTGKTNNVDNDLFQIVGNSIFAVYNGLEECTCCSTLNKLLFWVDLTLVHSFCASDILCASESVDSVGPVNPSAGRFQMQQTQRTNLPGQMYRPHPGGTQHPSSGHNPEKAGTYSGGLKMGNDYSPNWRETLPDTVEPSTDDVNDRLIDSLADSGGVLGTTNDGTHHDSSFVNATTTRLISGRRKSKKNTSSKVDDSIAKSGTLETISYIDSPRVQSTARRLISDRHKGKKNTSSKMADFFAKSSTIETISTKDALPEKTGMSSLVTGSANDEPASSRMKNRIKHTVANGALSSAAGRCYFPPGGREAGVAVFEEANERGSLVLKDEYNRGLDRGNANRKKTGADTMVLQDDYDPNWRDNVADTVKTKALPVNKNVGFQRQQKHRTPHPVAARHLRSGHFPPLSPSMLQNNGEGYRMSPANDKYNPIIRGNVGQWQNPQDAPDSAMFKGGQQQHHSQIPVSREPTFKINANLSIETTDERQDRYAGMEQEEVSRRDARTLVDSGPPHLAVGMGGSAVGEYGSINMTHNGMMGQQRYHGTAGNGESDGIAGKTTWNNNTGHQMMMAHQSPLDLMVNEWGSPYNHEHHMMYQGQLPQLYEQGHQPLQPFGQVNYVQQSHARTQAQIATPLDYNYGGMQHYHQAHGLTQAGLV